MRKETVKRGLEPNQWFNNVEIVTAEKIGIETTTYVRNIYKYYAAYKLVEQARDYREAERAGHSREEVVSFGRPGLRFNAGNRQLMQAILSLYLRFHSRNGLRRCRATR